VFNWAVAGLRRLEAQQGFTILAQMTAAIENFRQDDSPERAFATERLLAVEGADTPVREVYSAYEKWCRERNEKEVMRDSAFGSAIRRIFEGVSTKAQRDGDKVVKVWVGLHLMTD